MSHNLNIINGKASFFSAKEICWHKLGIVTDKALNSAEAIVMAGLNYEVGLAPIYVPIKRLRADEALEHREVARLVENDKPNYSEIRAIPKKFGTFRVDNGIPFGVVGGKYTIVQNIEAFDFFDSIIGKGLAQYETAGALGDGETIFITAKLPDTLLVNGKDEIDKYLLFTNTHDGSGAIQVLFTPIRVVCNNTLTMALQGANFKFTVRHTKSASDKLQNAAKVLGITNKATTELQQVFDTMSKTRIDDETLKTFISKSLDLQVDERGNLSTKAKNILKNVLEYNSIGIGQDIESCKGTVFGAYNAITGYFQNIKSYDNNEDKMNDIMFGTSAKKINTAYNLGLQLIK